VNLLSDEVHIGEIKLTLNESLVAIHGVDDPLPCPPYLFLFRESGPGESASVEVVVQDFEWRDQLLNVALEQDDKHHQSLLHGAISSNALVVCDTGSALGCRRAPGEDRWLAVQSRSTRVEVYVDSSALADETLTLAWQWRGMEVITERGLVGNEPRWIDRKVIVPRDGVRWVLRIGAGKAPRVHTQIDSSDRVSFRL